MSNESECKICPVCGQMYNYKREERKDGPTHVLRDDATECKVIQQDSIGFIRDKTYETYIHLNLTETNSVALDQQDESDLEIPRDGKLGFSGGPKDD